jgi:hypothetical protein
MTGKRHFCRAAWQKWQKDTPLALREAYLSVFIECVFIEFTLTFQE